MAGEKQGAEEERGFVFQNRRPKHVQMVKLSTHGRERLTDGQVGPVRGRRGRDFECS